MSSKRRAHLLANFLEVIVISILIISSGCTYAPKADILMENDYNNIGNMYIFPDIVQDGEYMYYIGLHAGLDSPSLRKANKNDFNPENAEDLGGNIEKLFLPSNGMLYYVNGDDNDSIYSMDKDGNNEIKLTDMTCDELITFQDKIYFTGADGLYSMGYDGSNLELVYPEPVTNLFPYGSYLYFIQTYEDVPVKDVIMDQKRIMRFCPNDNELKDIGGRYVERFFILSDRIYFFDEKTLCYMGIEGGDIFDIPEYYTHIDTMNFYGKYFIFSSINQPIGTFAIDSETGEVKKISDKAYNFINVLNDALFTNEGLIQFTDSK